MKIISLVSYPFLPARSGGQKGIALFYKYFSAHVPVTIVTTKKNQPGLADGYVIKNILSNASTRYVNPMIFFRIRKLILEQKATHFILEHPYYGWLGILVKKFCRVKLVVHSHNLEGNRWKSLGKWWWPLLWRYEKLTHRHADYNFFIQDADRKYAIKAFGLDEQKCMTVSFGTEIPAAPSSELQHSSAKILRQQLDIPEEKHLLLFNGAFNYPPNREALENLLFKVNPILQDLGLSYRLLILGLNIPEQLMRTGFPDTLLLGFAENLELYLSGCEIFLNPILSGGGIKTKLVEALAYDLNAVSTETGAIGVDAGICGGKLVICTDGDWQAFANSVARAIEIHASTPDSFYRVFYWENIARRAAAFIQ
jgi:polysaccharide biosynthesis protein PslH